MKDNERESGHALRGAHYSGRVSGAGAIEFDLSEEGDEVQNLRITQIPCDGGEHDQFPWLSRWRGSSLPRARPLGGSCWIWAIAARQS